MAQLGDFTGITVNGSGRAAAPPDVVRIDLAAEASADGVQAALADATEGLARMRDTLVGAGLERGDLRSTETSVRVDFGPRGDGPQRYVARLGLSATVRDLGSAGSIVQDALGSAGETARLSGLSFAHSDPSGLLVTAREAAFADARAKAERYVDLAGKTLGEVAAIDESGVAGPVPMAQLEAASTMANLAVEGGNQEVFVTVTVRWTWA